MRRIIAGVGSIALAAIVTVTSVAAAPQIGTTAFARVWDRQDRPVAEQVTDRSWTWGPAPISELTRENYIESPEGKRAVQYFDKSRMEINDPTADPNSQWYVTNGLLPIELMTGRMQVGNNQFEFHGPAKVSAIGDPDNWPTYADLLPYYQSPGAVNPGDLGKPATGMLTATGKIVAFNDYANDPATILVRGENNHGVATAFVDFMNKQGLVYEIVPSGNGKVYDPLFVSGLPLTGAYWVKTNVGGKQVPILFHVFERRVLTYNPANHAAFRVEMGNVGQHYYQWRYGK